MSVQYPSPESLDGISGVTIRVLLKMCQLADASGMVDRNQREIGLPLGLGESVVRRAILTLEASNHVTKDRTRRGNVYRLTCSQATRGAAQVNDDAPQMHAVTRAEAVDSMLAAGRETHPTNGDTERPIMYVLPPTMGAIAVVESPYFHAHLQSASAPAPARYHRAPALSNGAPALCTANGVPPLTLPLARREDNGAPQQQANMAGNAADRTDHNRGFDRGGRKRLYNELVAKLEAGRVPGADPATREQALAIMSDNTVLIERRCAEVIADLCPLDYILAQIKYVEEEHGHMTEIPRRKFFGALCQDWAGWIDAHVQAETKRERESKRHADKIAAQTAEESQRRREAEAYAAQRHALSHLPYSQIAGLITRAIARLSEQEAGACRAIMRSHVGERLLFSAKLRTLALSQLETEDASAKLAAATH